MLASLYLYYSQMLHYVCILLKSRTTCVSILLSNAKSPHIIAYSKRAYHPNLTAYLLSHRCLHIGRLGGTVLPRTTIYSCLYGVFLEEYGGLADLRPQEAPGM